MGVNHIGPAGRRRIERATGYPVEHCVTYSHHEHWYWWAVLQGHVHIVFDKRDGSYEYTEDYGHGSWCHENYPHDFRPA